MAEQGLPRGVQFQPAVPTVAACGTYGCSLRYLRLQPAVLTVAGELVEALGLAGDMGVGLEQRSKRFAIVLQDRQIRYAAYHPCP